MLIHRPCCSRNVHTQPPDLTLRLCYSLSPTIASLAARLSFRQQCSACQWNLTARCHLCSPSLELSNPSPSCSWSVHTEAALW
jgi:hypothetical protein